MGGVSMEWKEVRLGEVADVQTGPFGSQLHKENYVNKGTPIVTVEHLGNKWFTSQNLPMVSDEDKLRLAKYCSQEGDVIFSRVGSVDRCSYVSKEYSGWLFSGRCLRVRPRSGINPEYLYYFLTNEGTKQYIRNIAVGATMPSINTKLLNEVPITIPSLDDQHRIASILSSLDRKIELNNKINADLEEMAQAIFKNWFVDFEPFKDGKFVDSELGMIPEGWKVGSPYEYVKVVYGAPYKSAKFNDNGEGLPLIRIRDLKDCNPQFYTPEILPQTEYVNMGDIIAGMDAEFVPHIWKGNTGLLNQRVCKLMPQQTSISNLFVLYLMKPELEFVQSYKTGTTVSHLGKADIDKFVVVLPPLKVVEECSKILDSILQRIKNISAESRTLSTLRDTLLPRLMSGELEVPE